MSKAKPPPIKACLFDMDGLLIDSEDWYTVVTNEILSEYGKPDLPWDIKSKMQGRPGKQAGDIFQEWAQLPITREQLMAKTVVLQRKYFPRTKALPGVADLLQTLQQTSTPHIHLALATSSHRGNFAIKSAHLQDLFKVFPEAQRVLGDDSRIAKDRGKPAPDIYLLALETINEDLKINGVVEKIKPEECLVFEDSVPGVEAGRRAGMQVVWCPHPGLLGEYRTREKEVLAGLTGEHKEIVSAACDSVIEVPGTIDDGFAVLLKDLTNFPYERFGIRI